MPRYYLKTLGGLALVRCDDPSQDVALANSKALLILALLATRPGHTARRAELAELLWPDGDRPRALRALRQALFFLSRFSDGLLVRTDETLALDPEVVTVDLWEFDRAIAAESHATALALYGGPFAEGLERKVGVEVEHWIESINARVAVGFEVACTRGIADALAAGESGRAVSLARAFVARNPLEEDRQRLLARTLTVAGDRVGALQALEQYRKHLAGVLEETPSPELERRMQALRDELLHMEPPAPPPPAPSQPAERPALPETDDLDEAARRGRRDAVSGTALLAAAGGGLVTLALVVLLAAPREARPAAEPLDAIDARLLAVAQRGGEDRLVELSIRGSALTIQDQDAVRLTELPAPDGRTLATVVQAPDGWNLAVGTGPEDRRMATETAGDEYPVAWSPDSRHLVYAVRRVPTDGRTDSYGLAVFDMVRNASRALSDLTSAARPSAAWSPDGTRIAFTADVRAASEVFVVNFDGTNLRNLTRHPAWDGFPAWSPDGEQLVLVSRRGGRSDLYAIRPDGTDFRRLTRTTIEKRQPLWVSPVVVAFTAGAEGARRLQLLDVVSGQLREPSEAAGVIELLGRRDDRPAWVERLAVEPRVSVGSPGQHLAMSAVATDPKGEPVVSGAIPVEWAVTDSKVAQLDGPGRVRLLGLGRVAVVATVAGWRADTLVLHSVPVLDRPMTPVFSENWRGGLDTTRWLVFGDPPPTARSTGGPDGAGAFANRGDAFFTSGAVTVARFPLARGLGIDVEGRVPFTGKLHQQFGIALYPDDLPDSTLVSGLAPALVEFRIQGASGAEPAEAWVAAPDGRHPLPVPADLAEWHRYGLQVLEDGTVELMVDGHTYWRSSAPQATPSGGVRVGLGFQSFETEILHGRVRVYAPPRYALPVMTRN